MKQTVEAVASALYCDTWSPWSAGQCPAGHPPTRASCLLRASAPRIPPAPRPAMPRPSVTTPAVFAKGAGVPGRTNGGGSVTGAGGCGEEARAGETAGGGSAAAGGDAAAGASDAAGGTTATGSGSGLGTRDTAAL